MINWRDPSVRGGDQVHPQVGGLHQRCSVNEPRLERRWKPLCRSRNTITLQDWQIALRRALARMGCAATRRPQAWLVVASATSLLIQEPTRDRSPDRALTIGQQAGRSSPFIEKATSVFPLMRYVRSGGPAPLVTTSDRRSICQIGALTPFRLL